MSEWVLLHKEWLAKSVCVFHVIFMLWLVLGVIFAIGNKRLCMIYFSSWIAMFVSQLLFLNCPLTILQKALENYGEDRIQIRTGFVASLVEKLTSFKPPEVIITISTFIICLFAVIFLLISHRFGSDIQERISINLETE